MSSSSGAPNKKKYTRNKSAIRIPISLHFFVASILVIVVVVGTMYFYIQSIITSYIENECEARLETAVSSCLNFNEAFRTQIDLEDDRSDENIQAYLLNSIASAADLSNQATIVLYTYQDGFPDSLTLLWPSPDYSVSYYNSAYGVVSQVIGEGGHKKIGATEKIEIDGSYIYYRSLKIEGEGDLSYDLDNYYMLVYVNSRTYYSFTAAIMLAMIQAAFISLLIAGFLSLVATYPLLRSTRKLSKFASRIAKGDFNPITGHIVSRELSGLGDVMNQMAHKLEETDVEQKTFFQNASHELRTPLMSIQGYAEGIKCGVFEDEQSKEDAINVIIDETERLSNLVENLLSISKMDMSKSGSYEVQKKLTDVEKLCETVIDRVRGNFIHTDKDIVNDIVCNGLYIYANENDMLRCLENIFSNCLRYCTTSVKFICKPDKEMRYIIFKISDDGPGIAEDVLPHLFERFSKGSDGKHGIGLALAKAIVSEHGGRIIAYNKTEGGACFEIAIPLTEKIDQFTLINKNRN